MMWRRGGPAFREHGFPQRSSPSPPEHTGLQSKRHLTSLKFQSKLASKMHAKLHLLSPTACWRSLLFAHNTAEAFTAICERIQVTRSLNLGSRRIRL